MNTFSKWICLVLGIALCSLGCSPLSAAARDRSAARFLAEGTWDKHPPLQEAMFAGGCFWGVEEDFRTLKGVRSTSVGYCGGTTENPTYHEVCTGTTGYAETVKINFDPTLVTYRDLLKVFFSDVDPTTVNSQGPDHGTQYRSIVFYESDEQKAQALAAIEGINKSHKYSRPVVTEVIAAKTFYPAEDYHQQYLFKNGLPHCH